MPDNSAGRIPFFVEDGKIVFGLVAETNRIIDQEYIRQKCGDAAASLVPEKMRMYGLPRGTIETGETIVDAAGRESAEEIHYNATGHPVLDEDRNMIIPPHAGPIQPFLEKAITVAGKRGDYELTLFVDRIEPRSFSPKPMEDKTETKIKGRQGNIFQEGGTWGTMADLQGSLDVLQSLSRHPAVMKNAEVKELVDAQIKSMESQFSGMRDIETDLIRMLRERGETVRPAGGRAV